MILPELYKVYSFWDDGKRSESRQYVALVTRILTLDDAKTMRLPDYDDRYYPLYDYWYKEYHEYDYTKHLYAEDPQYFVECAIPGYDDHLIYFAPMKNGDNWFSFDVQGLWMGGELNISDPEKDEKYLIPELKEKIKNNLL